MYDPGLCSAAGQAGFDLTPDGSMLTHGAKRYTARKRAKGYFSDGSTSETNATRAVEPRDNNRILINICGGSSTRIVIYTVTRRFTSGNYRLAVPPPRRDLTASLFDFDAVACCTCNAFGSLKIFAQRRLAWG